MYLIDLQIHPKYMIFYILMITNKILAMVILVLSYSEYARQFLQSIFVCSVHRYEYIYVCICTYACTIIILLNLQLCSFDLYSGRLIMTSKESERQKKIQKYTIKK